MSYSPLELNNKVAVVVGGTSGIGLAIAKGMAEAGADVVPTSRRMDVVEAAASEIEQRGRRSIASLPDVSGSYVAASMCLTKRFVRLEKSTFS
jgi:NAD(P)-dependent dehydrogenase (short-subunit alcohol dehydrogenase family)